MKILWRFASNGYIARMQGYIFIGKPIELTPFHAQTSIEGKTRCWERSRYGRKNARCDVGRLASAFDRSRLTPPLSPSTGRGSSDRDWGWSLKTASGP
jgi:hypothetical protein